jgi:hypothetical protein
MAKVRSNSTDGNIFSPTTTWAGARDATAGAGNAACVDDDDYSSDFTAVSRFGSRGASNTYKVTRSFMRFNTSSITGTVSGVTIRVRGYGSNDGSVIAVKASAAFSDNATDLATEDFDAIDGYVTGSSLAGNATVYGTQIITTNWSTAGYNAMTGSNDLAADIQNNLVVDICFMDYTHDYLNSTPSSNGTFNCGGYYTDYTGTDRDPYIQFTETVSGYEHDVISVKAIEISKVITVATANIGKINTVD